MPNHGRRAAPRQPAARGLVGFLIALAASLGLTPAPSAAAVRTFTNAYAQTIHGDIAAIGNANSSCNAGWASCTPNVLSSSGNSSLGYGSLVDIDGNATTTNSSSDSLNIPAGATVKYARLEWGSAGDGTDNNGENTVKLDTPATPGIAYGNVTTPYAANCGSSPLTGNNRGFACGADVTTLVQAAGNGVFTVGAIEQRATTGGTPPDHWSGWGLYVVYEQAAQPLRRLVLADGFQRVATGANTTINASGFVAPASGAVLAHLTYIVGEGDAEIAGDNATFGSKLLDPAATPNLMDSEIKGLDYEGTRNPSFKNHYGYDIHSDDITGAIANASMSANFSFTTTQDTYYPFALGISIDLGEPDLKITKTLTDVNGGVVEPGDVIEYQIVAVNNGNDGAAAVTLTDPIPANTTYVPGSMQVTAGANAGAKTDAAGDDQGTFASNQVTMRVGTGATATAGGVLAAGGGTSTVKFRVQIATNVDEGVPLVNTAYGSYMGQTSGLAYADPSSVAATPVRRADMTVAQTPSSGLTAGQPGSLTLTASNIGGASTYAQPVTMTTTIPSGTTFTGITSSPGWSCTVSLPTITCTRSDALGASSAYPDVVLGLTPQQTATTVTFTSTVAGGNEVRTDNDSASTPITILRSANLRITKAVDQATARVGDTLTYTLTATNLGPSNTTGVTASDPLPASLQPLTATTTAGSCSIGGQVVTCPVGALSSGAGATITVTAKLLPAAAGTSVVNPAQVSGADPDPSSTNDAAQASTAVDPAADLNVTKTVTPTTQNVGGAVTWTVTVANNGPGPATGAAVTDTLPAGITVQSITPSQGTCGSGSPFSCALGTIASGATATIALAAKPALASAGTTLTNSATATTTAYDPSAANNTATSALTVNPAADLRVVKTADKATANVDDLITWSVALTNLGPSAAAGTTLTDTAPAGVTIQSVTPPAGASCSTSGQTISCSYPGPVPSGASGTVTIVAKVNRASAGSPLSNSATASSSTFDPDTANNLSSVTTNVNAAADLKVIKTADKATANVGDTITWTVTGTNTGASAATGVQLTDVLPAGVTLVSSTPSQGTCSLVGAQVVCAVGALAINASATVTLKATVDRAAAETPLQNVAQITGAQFDPDTANNSTNVTTTVGPATDLQITETVSKATATVGDALTYALTATNAGPSTATSLQLTSTLPAGFIIGATPAITGGTCTVSGQVVTCTLASLPSGGARLISIAGTVAPSAAGTTLTNTSSITGAQYDQDPSSNISAPVNTVVGGVAELSLTKTVDKANASVGDTLTYTVKATNAGPQNATGAKITDPLPSGLTLLTASASQGSCAAGSPIVCSLGTIPVGGAATVTITAKVGLALAGGPVTNTATTSSSQNDTNPANDSASATTQVAPAADLSVTKTVDKAAANVGDTITWTVTASNAGPSAATGVTINDTVPSGVTLSPISAPAGVTCSISGATVSCALSGALSSGGSQAITLSGVVKRTAAETPQQNTATVAGSQLDPDTSNNLSSVTTNVNAAADLRVSKVVDKATANVGDTLTWTVSVTNDGPSVATGVQLIDDLPAGTTLATRTATQGTCSATATQAICNVGTVASGATVTATLTAKVDRAAAESPVSNAARATANELDPDTSNNLSTAVTAVGPSTDLRISKAVDKGSANVGDTLTYTLTATNDGPSAATGVVVSDTLPASLTRTGTATTSQGSCNASGQTLTCPVGSLASGAAATITVQVTVTAAAAGTSQSNTATVMGAQPDPDPANNAAAPVTTVVAAAADLSITAAVDQATANVGDTLTYTFVVKDLGPQPATGVQATITMPAGVNVVSNSSPGLTCTASTPIVCTGSLPAGGAGATVTVTAKVLTGASSTIQSAAASVAGTQFDPVSSNNTDNAATIVSAAADVRISKTADVAAAKIGDTITYTLVATNDGPASAAGVAITDTLPASLQLVGSPATTQGTCSVSGQAVTCAAGTLANTASVTVTIKARVQASAAASTISNTASATTTTSDPTPGNDSSTPATTTVASAADLAVTQVVDQSAVNVGDTVVYTVTVKNTGPQAATSVALSDDLPAGGTLVSVAPSQGSCGAGDPFACALGTLAPGASATIAVRVKIVGAAESTFANVASATATQFDPNTGDNSATAATSTGASTDLSITKTADKAAANVGDTITWTVTATNGGTSTATGVTITDTAPSGVTLLPVTPPAGTTCGVSGQVVSCARSGSLAAGASVVITLQGTVKTAAAGTPLSNSATVAGNEFDPDTSNNLSAVTTTVNAEADLRIAKTVDQATANPGDTLTWTVVATNDGPSTATGVVVTDDIPAGVTLGTRTASQGTCAISGTQLVCTVGTLASGASATITITGTVKLAAAESPVDNAARVTSSVFDPDPADNLSTASTAVGPAADLRLAKAVDKAAANVGDTLRYTLTATNDGPSTATGATITDTLPSGLLISTTPSASQGACTVTGQTVSCSIGSLANAATATVTIFATVRPSASASSLANTASITGSRPDPDPSNNTTPPATTTVAAAADLVVTNVVDRTSVNLGDTAQFTVTVKNSGPSTATGVSLSDDLPPGTTLLSRTTTQGTCTSADPVVCSLGTLASGATATIVVRLSIDSGASATFATVATATAAQYEPTPADNTASAATSTGPAADLSLTKTADRPTADVGQTITWTITAANAGPSAASGVAVTDTIPAGISGVTASGGAGVTCAVGSTAVSCAIAGPWAAGTPRVITLTGVVARSSAGSPLSNQASIAGSEFDPSPSNNVSTATTNVNAAADLKVTKVADKTSAGVGDTLTWTVTATNDGPSAAAGAAITDDLPAGVTLVSATSTQGTCSPVGTQVICAVGAMASGQVVTATLAATVNVTAAESPVVNAARVTSSTFDPDTSNNLSSVSTAIAKSVDLTTSAVVDRATANIGDQLLYTFTIANGGPSSATNASFTHLLPANTTIVASTASQGGCSTAGTTLTCTLGTIPSTGSATVTVRVSVAAAAAGTTINARGSATAAETDRTPANNTSQVVTTSVATATDLLVTASADRSTVAVGDTVTYLVTVTNDGPSTATGVVLTDALPVGATILSATPSQGSCTPGAPRICAIGSLAPGASATLTVQARAEAGNSGALMTDAASATADQFDPNTGNNAAQASSAVGDAADLQITKSSDHTTAQVGDTITWTLVAKNLGPMPATGVTVSDAVPAGVTITSATSATGTCTVGSPVTCAIGGLANGAAATITVVGRVERAAADSPLASQATITGSELDPNPGNNVSASLTTVGPSADLRVVKLVDTSAPAIGDVVTWTIQVFNDGPSAATGVQLTDVVPAGAPIDSATSTAGSCSRSGQSVACAIGTLAGGTSAIVTIKATVAASAGGAVLDNAASASAATRDPDPSNNTSTARATAGAAADLNMTLAPDRTSAVVGDVVHWMAVVGNAGPQTGRAVVATVTLPASVASIQATVPGGTCTVSGQVVTCSVPDVPAGSSVAIDLQGTVGRGAAESSLGATAAVTGSLPDPATPNNVATAGLVTVPAAVDLVVTKTSDRDAAAVGDPVTITTSILNRGPSAATGVVFTDTIPEGVSFRSVTPSQGTCTVDGRMITCDAGTIVDGQTVTVTLVVVVMAEGADQSLLNAGSATSGEFDTNGSNNAATIQTGGIGNPVPAPVATPAPAGPAAVSDVSVTKVVDKSAPVAGNQVVWTITATNHGRATAYGVRVSDSLPAGLDYVTTKATGGTCTRNARTITCVASSLPAGASLVVKLTTVVSWAGGPIDNAATVTTAQQPNSASRGQVASVRVRATGSPYVVAGIKPLEPYTRPGRRVRIAVKITNVGVATANDVVGCFTLPKGIVLTKKPAGLTQRGAKFCLTDARLAQGKNKRVVLSARVVGGAGTTRPTVTGSSSNSRVKTEAYPLIIRGAQPTRAAGVTG